MRSFNRTHKKPAGFTLIELVVTIAVFFILSSIALPNLKAVRDQMRLTEDARSVANILTELRAESIRLKRPIRVHFTSTLVQWDYYNDGSYDGSYSLLSGTTWTTVPVDLTFNGFGLLRSVTTDQSLAMKNGINHPNNSRQYQWTYRFMKNDTATQRSTRGQRQSGFAIVESLVAIALVGIAMVGVTSLYVTSFNSNASARSYAAVESDVATIIDGYRNLSYPQLLQKFSAAPTDIADGQSVNETSVGAFSKANYAITLTALKSSNGATPEALRIQVVATQRRGVLNTTQYDFETLLAPTA